MKSCNSCESKVNLLYDNKPDKIMIFHCESCKTAYIYKSNIFAEEVPEHIAMELILLDPFNINFINQVHFYNLTTKYIKI